MSNPYVDLWMQMQNDPEAAEGNPYVTMYRQMQDQGKGGVMPLIPSVKATAGGFVSGLAKPLEGLFGLPGAVSRFLGHTDELLTDRVANAIGDFREDVLSAGERHARSLGYTDRDLRGTRMLGELIGYAAPGAALYKATARALGATSAAEAIPFAEGLKIDVISGMVWGGALTPGEVDERLKNATIDGGLSGAIGLALTGVWPAVVGYRNTRVASKFYQGLTEDRKRELLTQFYGARRRGEIGSRISLTGEADTRAIFDILNEESFIVNSPAAQNILARNADETALVQAIVDVAGAGGSQGVVRQIGQSFEDAVEVTAKMKNEFPSLRFDVLKNTENGYDVVFGTRGLSNKQKAQFKKEGRFEGQVIQREDGTTYEYLGKIDNDWIKVRTVKGTETRVKAKNLTDMSYGIEPELRAPVETALYDDFQSFFGEKSAGVLNERYNFSETDLVTMARDGRLLNVLQESRRRISEPNAIVHADEVGIPTSRLTGLPENQIMGARLQSAEVEGRQGVISRTVADESDRGVHIRDEEGNWRVAEGETGKWRLTQLAEGEPVTHLSFRTFDDAAEYAQETGFQAQHVEIPAVREIQQTGIEHNWLMEPWDGITFEDAVRLWAQERGLATEGAEFVSLQTSFANRMREQLYDRMVKEYPEENALLDRLRSEWDQIMNTEGLPLESRAAVKGFHVKKLPQNAGWELVDINTGASFHFQNQALLNDALDRVQRGDRSIGEFGLPADVESHVMSPSAVSGPPAEDILADALPDEALSHAMRKDIPTRVITNTRDLLLKYEDRTGIPLWRLGFSRIDEGMTKALHEYSAWGENLDNTFRSNGIRSRKDGVRLGEYLMEAEKRGLERGTRLTPTERYQLARDMGLSTKDYQAIKEFRRTMDAGFVEYGLEPDRYIEDYFGRILPYARENGMVPEKVFDSLFPEGIPEHLNHFAQFARTGALSQIETDVRLVAHKWFKAAAMKRHTDEPYNFLARAIKMQVRDLPKEQKVRLEKNAGRRVDEREFVLNDPIRNILKEYLNSVRGAPVSSVEAVQGMFGKLYQKMGVKVDERVSTEFFNTMLSTMYGAAMGARPALLARNHMQTMWNLYIRLGGKQFSRSMRDVVNIEGFRKALDAGAIRSTQAAIPMHDAIFEEIVEAGAQGTGPFSNAVAAAMNHGLSLGRVSRKVAEKTLIPYGTGDSFSRAWAFHYQRRHTADLLNKFEQRRVSWETFKEKGLPFYDRAVIQEFADRYKYQGKDAALDFIGVQAANETHFIYGMGNQPAWMQNPFGKFMGMFGTWPLWQKEVYARIMRNGTPMQKRVAWARTAGMIGALGLVGHSIGVNMTNWMAPLFVTWTGGPGVDYAIDVKNLIDAPLDRKAQAMQRLAQNVPRLALPGQVLMTDIGKAMEATDDPRLQAMYLMVGRPTDAHYLDFVLEDALTPRKIVPTTAPPTSVAPSATYQQVDLEALGLEPRIVGGGSGSTVTTPQYDAMLEWLGGNVPR